jgi:hypothetical protein
MQFNKYWQLEQSRPGSYKTLKELTMRKFRDMELWFKKHHALSIFGRIGKLRRDLDEYEYRVHWIYQTLKNGGVPPNTHGDIAMETAKDLYNVNSKAVRKEPQRKQAGEARGEREREVSTRVSEDILAKELFPGFKPIRTTGKGKERHTRICRRHNKRLHPKDRYILKELALL